MLKIDKSQEHYELVSQETLKLTLLYLDGNKRHLRPKDLVDVCGRIRATLETWYAEMERTRPEQE
jgi:hypothetical protein